MLEGRHRRERRSRAKEPRRRKTTTTVDDTVCVYSVRNQSNHVMRRGVSFRRSSPAPARASSWSYQCPTWSQRMKGAPRRCHSCPCSRRLGESGFSECESLTHGFVQSLNGFAATDKVWNPGGKRSGCTQRSQTDSDASAIRGSLIIASVHSQRTNEMPHEVPVLGPAARESQCCIAAAPRPHLPRAQALISSRAQCGSYVYCSPSMTNLFGRDLLSTAGCDAH